MSVSCQVLNECTLNICKRLQVFRCSEPDGYELLAVLPGMSIDDIR